MAKIILKQCPKRNFDYCLGEACAWFIAYPDDPLFEDSGDCSVVVSAVALMVIGEDIDEMACPTIGSN